MTVPRSMPGLTVTKVKVANAGTESNALALNSESLCAVITPAAFTGTSITFLASCDGTNFAQVCMPDGNPLELTVTANKHYSLNPAHTVGIVALKVVCGTQQAAEREIKLVTCGAVNR